MQTLDRAPDTVLTGNYYNIFNAPCVYAWVRANTWLYVGMSNYGFNRVFRHNVIGVKDKVYDTDSIFLWSCADSFSACIYETELILQHKPKYNKTQDLTSLLGYALGTLTPKKRRL